MGTGYHKDSKPESLHMLDDSLNKAKQLVFKSFYDYLNNYDIEPLKMSDYMLNEIKPSDLMSLLKIKKITMKKNEEVTQKLTNVFNSIIGDDVKIVFLIDSMPNKETNLYIGTITEKAPGTSKKSLISGVKANFPGTTYEEVVGETLVNLLEDTLCGKRSPKKVASVSAIGSIRDNKATDNTAFVQGIERLMETMAGQEYVACFLASRIHDVEIDEYEDRCNKIYTTISQFKKVSYSVNENNSEALSDSISNTMGTNMSQTEGSSYGSSESHTKGESTTNTVGGSASATVGAKVSFLGQGVNASATASVNASKAWTQNTSHTSTSTSSVNYNYTSGTNQSTSNTYGITDTLSKGTSVQIEMEDKKISSMLDAMDIQLERLNEGKDYGLYNIGAYFLSNKKENMIMAANTYKALITGEDVSCENSAINYWEDKEQVEEIKNYLAHGENPLFVIGDDEKCRPSTMVTGLELPLHMNLPQKSVWGIDVVEHAEFGRNTMLHTADQAIELGCLHHMGEDYGSRIQLSKKDLAAHTFITGSTGSGKSNTVYKLLQELKKDVKFMVIEPAKGEYKEVFGGHKDVTVYGTNPYKYNKLLQINPFSFPEDIHVLEHVDRVVEIFNACWPMYAAMPAILKESIERSYEECGWNLRTSKGKGLFPTFDTLLEVLPKVIDDSSYSSDTSSDYKGALVTRVRSLTRGIHGQIFDGDIDAEQLFNTNTIVDISRIGSAETKSLLMGILVLKLQEFRMSEDVTSNSGLRHVTVLEEAHNLLKKTSGDQGQEGANVQGKSVEMIANAIAEMRTYGEGFIIADQSPGLMDMSVIRNTNTKIIMRLPDETDRHLVGKAAGLTEEQIVEIARLGTGVAATYQSGWTEAVLCKVDYFNDIKPYELKPVQIVDTESISVAKLINNLFSNDNCELSLEDVDNLNRWLRGLNLSSAKEKAIKYAIQGKKLSDAGKMSALLSISRVRDISNRELVIRKAKDTVAMYDLNNSAEIIRQVEILIRNNITEHGKIAEKNIR